LKQRLRYHLQKSKEEIRAEYRRLNRSEAAAFRRRWDKTKNFDWVTITKKQEEQHLVCMHTFWLVSNLSCFEAGFASQKHNVLHCVPTVCTGLQSCEPCHPMYNELWEAMPVCKNTSYDSIPQHKPQHIEQNSSSTSWRNSQTIGVCAHI
jgi:hypothetical protein